MKSTPLQAGVSKRKRQAHVIRKTGGNRMPTRLLFFDVETKEVDDKGTQKMKLAYAAYWTIDRKTGIEQTEWFSTTKQKDLYDYISGKCVRDRNIRVLSANIWFDLRVSGLLDHLRRSKWLCKRFFTRGHTMIAVFSNRRNKIEFVNIQNYFNIPVVAIGRSIGLPKYEIDLNRCSEANLRVYCKRDVEIILKAFKSLYYFIRDNKLGSLGYTLPSISYSCFLTSFLKGGISVHTKEDIIDLERKAYFGGRCECFRIGKFKGERFYKLDVNAMYPYVMGLYDYPVAFVKSGTGIVPGVLTKLAHKWCYIAEVTLKTDKPIYPFRLDGKLIFPTGMFTTYLSTPSLMYAIKNKHVKKIVRVAAYKKRNLFKEFVNYFYGKRLEYRSKDNPAFAYVCKLILNSLYGKFGQKSSVTIYQGEVVLKDSFRRLIWQVQEQRYYIHQVFYGLEQMIQLREVEGLNSVPSICGHVTDYARMYLWQLIEKAGRSNCYYCDTDSLIVNGKGVKRLTKLMATDLIGMLKIEDIAEQMEIRGAKNYTFGDKRKIKGIPSKAVLQKDGSYKFIHFPTAMSELRDGLKEDYRIETRSKKLTGEYTKGVVLKSGRVRPFSLPD